VRKLSTKAK
jgi:bis(5'-adenosyl)-triphosphatase